VFGGGRGGCVGREGLDRSQPFTGTNARVQNLLKRKNIGGVKEKNGGHNIRNGRDRGEWEENDEHLLRDLSKGKKP